MQQDVSRPDRSRCEEGPGALKSPFGPEARTDTAEQTTRCRFIITDDPVIRSRELNSAITALAREGLAVTRMGNPLTVPLTTRRIVIQLDFDNSDDNESEDDGDEAYLARILERLAARGPLALIIEQAETLDTAALRTLWQTGLHNESVVIVFVGTTGFWPLLRQADLAPPHNELKAQGTLSEEITKPASHEQRTYPSASSLHARPYAEGVEKGTLRQPKVTPTRPSWTWRLYTAFLITLVLGVGVAANRLFYHATPPVSVTQRETSSDNVTTPESSIAEPQSVPGPSRSEGSSQPTAEQAELPAELAPPSLEAPARTSEAAPEKAITEGMPDRTPPARPPSAPRQPSQQERLRAEFDEFLARSGAATAAMSETQRSNLFREYLASRSDGAAPMQSVSPPPRGRIVIHYREGGSPIGDRLKTAAAASFAGSVETRAVAASPSIAEIRFFHTADEFQARKLAGALRGLQPRWEVRDFRAFRPSPSPGMIEVWLPAR